MVSTTMSTILNLLLKHTPGKLTQSKPKSLFKGIPLSGLNLPHLWACSYPGPGFPSSYAVVFIYVQWVKVRVVCFVDIGWIVGHHCLNLLFIIKSNYILTPNKLNLCNLNTCWFCSRDIQQVTLYYYQSDDKHLFIQKNKLE